VHFGHYKAVARDRYLSALEAAKLSLATRIRIPLERLGSALRVLLEKEFGNIYIKKMQAICLMEADFNWFNKLVISKRMMDQAYDSGNVPLEQFARRGTQAAHGVLCKVLFCDYVRALHIVVGIPSVRFLSSNSRHRVTGVQSPLTEGSFGPFSPSNNDLLSLHQIRCQPQWLQRFS
jgi:hypothetical protein